MLVIRLDEPPGPGAPYCGLDHRPPPINDNLYLSFDSGARGRFIVKYRDATNYYGSVIRIPWSVLPPTPSGTKLWMNIFLFNTSGRGHVFYTLTLPLGGCSYLPVANGPDQLFCYDHPGDRNSYTYWDCDFTDPSIRTNRVMVTVP